VRVVRLLAAVGLTMVAMTVVVDAAQALPRARPPDQGALRALGLRVGWPVARSSGLVRVPLQLTVRVRLLASSRARAGRRPVVRVVLQRVVRSGVPMTRLAAATLRAGSFAATLPDRPQWRFALRLMVGSQRYVSWVAPFGPFTAVPSPACPTTGQSAATLTVSAAQGRTGDRLRTVLRNQGSTCLSGTPGFEWQLRRPDGSWQEGDHLTTPIGVVAVPGAVVRQSITVPALPAGQWRIVRRLHGPDAEVLAAAPFQILGRSPEPRGPR
jgi:hypothetical protein